MLKTGSITNKLTETLGRVLRSHYTLKGIGKMSEKIFTTKELAILCSSSKKTIRHYKKVGLLEPSYIDGNGYWYFNQEDLERMDIIQQLKLVGFSLDEIKKIIKSEADVNELIEKKLAIIEGELFKLKLSKSVLAKMDGTQDLSSSITNSVHKEHAKWIDENISEEALSLFKSMRSHGHDDEEHMELGKLLRLCKVPLFNKDDDNLLRLLNQIDNLLEHYIESSDKKKKIMTMMLKIMTDDDSYPNGYSKDEATQLFSKYEALLMQNDI